MRATIETCVTKALAGISPAVSQRFVLNPRKTLQEDIGLTVRAVDHLDFARDDGGICDGISYLEERVILYRRTGNRRENFTLAHELGHWLVDQGNEIYDLLATQAESAKQLESVCDCIAQQLLLPAHLVESTVSTEPIQARHVTDLYASTSASLPACAIALARRLPGLGAVVVIDRMTQTVEYASVRPDDDNGWPLVYPWPRQEVPAGHPLRNLKANATLRRRTFWETRWGRRDDYYLDALATGRRTIAILSGSDLWGAERFHPQSIREFDRRPETEIECCRQVRKVRAWPCDACKEPHCPVCGRCRCDRRASAEVLCKGTCAMKYLPHLLMNGLCGDCR